MTEVRRLLAAGLGSEEEETAMALIGVAEKLKEEKKSWEEAEEEIRSSGGAACLVCASCRHEFSDYSCWRKHRCRLAVPTEPGTSTYRVLTVLEEKDFKEATEHVTLSMTVRICVAARVCVPGLFPFLYLPHSRWSTATLGWLGEEVGAVQRSQANLKEVREDGVKLPDTMTVRTRDGGLLELSSLLKPINYDVESEEESDGDSKFDSDLYSSSDNSDNSDDSEGGDEELDDLGDWAMLIPDSDPTVGPSETVGGTVTGQPGQEDGAGDIVGGGGDGSGGGGSDEGGGDGREGGEDEGSEGDGGGVKDTVGNIVPMADGIARQV